MDSLDAPRVHINFAHGCHKGVDFRHLRDVCEQIDESIVTDRAQLGSVLTISEIGFDRQPRPTHRSGP